MSRPHRSSLVAVLAAATTLALLPMTAATAASGGKRELWLRHDGSNSQLDLRNSGVSAVSTRISSAGGDVSPAAGKGPGHSARTPTYSSSRPARPAVVVVTPRDGDPLEPGTRAFVFGAHFHLDAKSQGSSTDNGNNLVQRGLFRGAQYKLQVDHRRISCRVSGSQGAVSVRASTRIDPRYWYRGTCTRNGGRVTLALTKYVGGKAQVQRWSRSGATGALRYRSSTPLSVGGKVNGSGDVIARDSDQFNGRIDNAFFRLL